MFLIKKRGTILLLVIVILFSLSFMVFGDDTSLDLLGIGTSSPGTTVTTAEPITVPEAGNSQNVDLPAGSQAENTGNSVTYSQQNSGEDTSGRTYGSGTNVEYGNDGTTTADTMDEGTIPETGEAGTAEFRGATDMTIYSNNDFSFETVSYYHDSYRTVINSQGISSIGGLMSADHANSLGYQGAVSLDVNNFQAESYTSFQITNADQVIIGSIIFNNIDPISEFTVENGKLLKAKVVSGKDNNIFRLPVSQPDAPSTLYIYANQSQEFKVDYTDGTKIWVSRGL